MKKQLRKTIRATRTRLAILPLEERAMPAIFLPTAGTPGGAYMTGGDLPDSYIVRLAPGNPANVQFSDNGGATFNSAALADITGVFVQQTAGAGSASTPSRRGADTLTIDHSNGFVGKAGGLTVDFIGGSGKDAVVLKGDPGSAVAEVYNQAAGSTNEGTIMASAPAASLSVHFAGVSLVRDTMKAASFTFNPVAGDNFVVVGKGKRVDGAETLRLEGIDHQGLGQELDLLFTENTDNTISSRAGLSFVPVDLNGKATVTVNTGIGNDLVVLDSRRAVPGLSSLVLDGGTGSNTLYRDDSPAGATVSVSSFATIRESASAETFIIRHYTERLKRLPGADEISQWKASLSSVGVQGVSDRIDRSGEAYSRQVDDWYAQYLGRPSDDAGRANWIDVISRRSSEERGLSYMLSSAEYYQNAQVLSSTGSPDDKFVRALYQDLLNRAPEAAGELAWRQALTRFSRADIAFAFLSAPEFRTGFVNTLYSRVLGRDADSAGLAAWTGSILDDSDLRRGFRSSSEYYDDSRVGAGTISLVGSAVSFSGVSANHDDKRYFEFIAPRTGAMRADVAASAGAGSLEVEDAFGNTVFETEPNNGINGGNFGVTAGVKYFLRLRSSNASAFSFRVDLLLP